MLLLHEELIAVAGALEADRVPYALVGGLAVAVWGAPRATKDIDLLIEPGDVDRAKAAIARVGYVLPAEPMEFSDGMQVHRLSKVVDRLLVTVDLLLVNQNLRAYFQQRCEVEIQDTPQGLAEGTPQDIRAVDRIWVITRQGLIAMKVSAGRPQDQADVIRLKDMDR